MLLCAVQLRDISGAGTRIRWEKRSEIFNIRPRANMGDSDKEKSDQEETDISGHKKDLEKKIKKEIDKLKFYLEEDDELLEDCDYSEIALTCKRTDEIQDRLNDLVSTLWRRESEVKVKRPRRRNSEPNSSRKSNLDAKSNNKRRNFGKKR